MRSFRNRKQVIESPPDSPEVTAAPNSLDVHLTPVEGQGGDSPRESIQMRDLTILLEEGRVEDFSSDKGHDAPFLIGPKGHEEALLGRNQPDQARIGASSSGNEGQGGTSSSRNEDLSRVVAFMRGPEGPGEPSQVFTSEKEVQGKQDIISAPPENANQKAASLSPRLNANYRAQASNEIHIKKINYRMGTWSFENGQAMGYFSVTRSDDKKVPMDNQFLREKYPQMLIDFYEQKLQKDGLMAFKTSGK